MVKKPWNLAWSYIMVLEAWHKKITKIGKSWCICCLQIGTSPKKPIVCSVVFPFLDFNSSLNLSLVFGAIWQNRLSSLVHLAPTVRGSSSFESNSSSTWFAALCCVFIWRRPLVDLSNQWSTFSRQHISSSCVCLSSLEQCRSGRPPLVRFLHRPSGHFSRADFPTPKLFSYRFFSYWFVPRAPDSAYFSHRHLSRLSSTAAGSSRFLWLCAAPNFGLSRSKSLFWFLVRLSPASSIG
jgi:hypothetical protein